MTINQILYFVTTVESKTFLEAADVLNLSQSSLSKSLQRLEEELGLKLFDRTKRSASLTTEGQAFYQGAQKILAAYRETMSQISDTASQLKGSIRLATLPILSAYQLTGPLRSFATQYQGIELIIDEMEDTKIIKELEDGTCDLAILRLESIHCERYHYDPLATDELVLVTSLNHPLASRTEVSLEELKQEAFILMNKYISIYGLCIETCKAHGYTPNVIRTARIESILSAVAANEGISLLMRKNIDMFNHDDVVIIPLKENITSTVVLVTQKNKKVNKNARILIQYLNSLHDK